MAIQSARLRRWVEEAVKSQRQWIADCGGTRDGYRRRYGSYGDGWEAIYDADMARLRSLEARLR